MPWTERTCMSERSEFVELAQAEGANLSELSRRYGVSRKTAYKWRKRFAEEGPGGLVDRSRKPHRSPLQTDPELETQVVMLRLQHPSWGGRKLHHRLKALGLNPVPAPSTITGILRRYELLRSDRRLVRDWQRFEAEEPNDLWQMDFKGHIATDGGRCHPLTVLDDHSRYNVCLKACGDEQATTVQEALRETFSQYGLPLRMLMDNGSPWGSERAHPHTRLTAWLIRLGITVLHGRPYHPQTQGKDERFHRTLNLEVLQPGQPWPSLPCVQEAFERWRPIYNLERPHEALENRPPVSRYTPSRRSLPAAEPEAPYERGEEVRIVQDKGRISFKGHDLLVSRAFTGDRVVLRPVADGIWDVFYYHQRVATISLTGSAPPARQV